MLHVFRSTKYSSSSLIFVHAIQSLPAASSMVNYNTYRSTASLTVRSKSSNKKLISSLSPILFVLLLSHAMCNPFHCHAPWTKRKEAWQRIACYLPHLPVSVSTLGIWQCCKVIRWPYVSTWTSTEIGRQKLHEACLQLAGKKDSEIEQNVISLLAQIY
jgi:hypothetical protein